MNNVEPIRNKIQIKEMIKHLKKNHHPRDYVLFNLGLHTALRVTEMLKINYNMIFTQEGNFKQYLIVDVKSTRKKKARKIKLNPEIKRILKKYAEDFKLEKDDPLFFALREPFARLDRICAWRNLKKASNFVGIENFGTHSMRKTWGYHCYKSTKNLGLIMRTLEHSRPDVTLRYIGINQDVIDDGMQKNYWK